MAVDYSRLMDAETLAFIRRIDGFYPPAAADWPIEKNRAVYDRMSAAFHAGRPAGVRVRDEVVTAGDRDIQIRLYSRADTDHRAIVFYLHGGGFILGGLDSHDDICAELCAGTGYDTVSVGYRLAPEHQGTAAFDDVYGALRWTAAAFGQPIVMVGESAGGSLCASLAHATRGERWQPAGQVLVYPLLGGHGPRPSIEAHADAPMLTARELQFYRNIRTGGRPVGADTRFEALADTDFSDLPPTLVFTSQCDPLASDGPIYAERIVAAGGQAASVEAAGLPHGYLRGRHMIARAGVSFTQIVATTAALGRGEWPNDI